MNKFDTSVDKYGSYGNYEIGKIKKIGRGIEMNGKIVKSSLAAIQSFLVILLTYLLSAVRRRLFHNTIALYILHYFVFYISDYGQDFFKRGYLIELVQTLKYILFFALAIIFLIFS